MTDTLRRSSLATSSAVSTRGELLAAASAVLEVMAARIADRPEYSYAEDIRSAWDAAFASAASISSSFGLPSLARRAFEELVDGMATLPEDLIPDWLDLFPRNVLDLVQV